MFEELRKSQWVPVVIAGLSILSFITIEVLWMTSLKVAMGR